MDLRESNQQMTALLSRLATREGVHPTRVDGVNLMRASKPIPRMPVLYEPGIVIVGQGRKRGYLGEQVYTYDAHNYLVLSVPLPFECETEASPGRPMLAVSVRVDLALLAELLMKMDGAYRLTTVPDGPAIPQGIYSTKLDSSLSETTVRLLECLGDPMEAQILGPQTVRELTYRVLRGQQGGALQRIHADYASDLNVEELAETAAMSPSAFHQNFKAVTSTSPLQYLKTTRLHKARMLMVYEGLRAGVAAERVGYESSSQFSREFKRLFGASPVEAAEGVRRMLGVE
jgi:AraC-like DNA-binding protein